MYSVDSESFNSLTDFQRIYGQVPVYDLVGILVRIELGLLGPKMDNVVLTLSHEVCNIRRTRT